MKMKNLVFLCFLTLVLLFTAPSALAVTTVVGTGDPNIDVPAVQAAVNGGGMVLLKGDFHFGDWGWVNITNSVEIIGEGATINYGDGTFWIATPEGTPGIDVIIRGSGDNDRLTFMNSKFAAIGVWDPESLTIKHVDIYDVVAAPWGDRFGIWARKTPGPPPWDPLLLGKLSIINCTIDLGDQNEKEYGTGIGILGLGTPENKVNILIKDNIISNCSAYGIDLFNIAGTASVVDNTVMPGEIAFKYMGSGGTGISVGQNPNVGYNFTDGLGTYQPDWADIFVRNNDIECGTISGPDDFNYTMGIEIWNLKGVVVRKNKIKGEEGDIGSLISMNRAKNAFIKKNILSGTCLWCLEAFNSSENIFVVGNDLRNVIPPLDEESSQMWFGRGTKNSLAVNNKIGEPGMWGGIGAAGEKAHIANNTFYGDYPGWSVELGLYGSPVEKGCVYLGRRSSNNMVVDVKLADPPPDFDMCDQVLDRGTNNRVVGCK